MNSQTLDPKTLKRLHVRAAAQGVSVDALICQLLDADVQDEPTVPYNLLLENMGDVIALFDLDLRYIYANPVLLKLTGWSLTDIIGKTDRELGVPEAQLEHWKRTWDIVRRTKQEQVITFDYPTTEGDRFFESRLTAILDAQGDVKYLMAVTRDVTSRTEIQNALIESETRYRILTELMSDYAMSVRIEDDGFLTVEWIIGKFEEITGYSTDIYHDPDRTIIHPDDQEMVREAWQVTLLGEQTASEYRIIAKSGKVVWLRVSRMPIWDDEAGRVIRFYSGGQDITRRKEAEEIALEKERLRLRLQKEQELNGTIQQMVSELSHDIATPLSIIATTKDLLSRYSDQLGEAQRNERIALIDKELRLVVEMLDDLSQAVKAGFRQRMFDPAPVNLASLCEMTIREIERVSEESHPVKFVTDGKITTVLIDETLVSRILLNLLTNAVKFSPPGSEIQLHLHRRDDWIVLRVIDRGMGISEEDQRYIFDSLYRSKQAENISGTGLGLSIVKECVQRHGGTIAVESEVGTGTTFIVKLPLAGQDINDDSPPAEQKPARTL